MRAFGCCLANLSGPLGQCETYIWIGTQALAKYDPVKLPGCVRLVGRPMPVNPTAVESEGSQAAATVRGSPSEIAIKLPHRAQT